MRPVVSCALGIIPAVSRLTGLRFSGAVSAVIRAGFCLSDAAPIPIRPDGSCPVGTSPASMRPDGLCSVNVGLRPIGISSMGPRPSGARLTGSDNILALAA